MYEHCMAWYDVTVQGIRFVKVPGSVSFGGSFSFEGIVVRIKSLNRPSVGHEHVARCVVVGVV